MRYRPWATRATPGNRERRDRRRPRARTTLLLWSATALLAAGAASARLTTGAGQPSGDRPAPVQPGDLLASTGNQGGTLIAVDPITGEGTPRFELAGVTEIVYRSDGTLFGSTGEGDSQLIVVDPDTGDVTPVGEHDFGALNGLEFVDGTLYGTFFAPGALAGEQRVGASPTFLVTVDPETAELTPIGEVGFSPVRGLAYDSASSVLYGVAPTVIEEQPVDSVLLTIDLETGTGAVVGPVGYAVGGIRFGPDGILYGGTVDPQGDTGGNLITIDPVTGAGTEVGDTGFPAISGLAFVLPPLITPADLEVDFSALDSDGNGVLEPGERVEMAPLWNNAGSEEAFADGILMDFNGPEGASYDVVLNGVGYLIPAGESSSCQDTDDCYQLEIQITGPERPAVHWDATVDEELTTGPSDSVTHTWALHVGDSFTDVPRTNLFYTAVETLLHSGVSGGCGGGEEYCPGDANSRAQMPVFMLRALEGADYTPPACDEGDEAFDDVPFDSPFCPWIQELFDRGSVSGCGGGNYCPTSPVSRAQMAIFLLKTLEGDGYEPPECNSMFDDVPCPSLFADWIEDLAVRGITGGCTTTEYCPGNPVSRAQMASFVTKTFGLALYGP